MIQNDILVQCLLPCAPDYFLFPLLAEHTPMSRKQKMMHSNMKIKGCLHPHRHEPSPTPLLPTILLCLLPCLRCRRLRHIQLIKNVQLSPKSNNSHHQTNTQRLPFTQIMELLSLSFRVLLLHPPSIKQHQAHQLSAGQRCGLQQKQASQPNGTNHDCHIIDALSLHRTHNGSFLRKFLRRNAS